jgi:hypothetical protein
MKPLWPVTESTKSAAEPPELGRLHERADVLRVAAEPGEVERRVGRLAVRRAHAVVERVVDQRGADERGGPLADRFAQVAAGQQRLALADAVAVEVA